MVLIILQANMTFPLNTHNPTVAGVAQGVVTGIRGLCNGLGPALFGFIFFLFHVDLNEPPSEDSEGTAVIGNQSAPPTQSVLHNIREVSEQGPMTLSEV
jgi:hypothetical protein